ncbi:hypothetical protein GQ457_07G033140 [Hibiscus cannabinus]
MVGSGSADRSKEAVGMMALHEALRTVCLNSDWTYSVFWTIRPRSRVSGGNGCKVGDDNDCLMLMWEDGFCKGRVADCLEEIDGEDPVRKSFSKMSIQLYNYGEGWVLDIKLSIQFFSSAPATTRPTCCSVPAFPPKSPTVSVLCSNGRKNPLKFPKLPSKPTSPF